MKESFGKVYARLYRENFKELESLRNKARRSKALAIISVPLIPFVMMVLAGAPAKYIMVIVGLFIIGLIYSAIIDHSMFRTTKGQPEYVERFKEKIVGPIIENMFEGAKYEAKNGIPIKEYIKAGYRERIDNYSSEDLITAQLKLSGKTTTVISLADVHIELGHINEELRDVKYLNYQIGDFRPFYGIVGSFSIPKDIGKRIYIRSNGTVADYSKRKVKMDMPEFEKIFDVESEDEVLAMRILTADVMAEMIDLYNKYQYRFEISIINDAVYMRLKTGDMFEPNVFKSSLEYKQLEKYYLVLKALINIATHICDTILKLDI